MPFGTQLGSSTGKSQRGGAVRTRWKKKKRGGQKKKKKKRARPPVTIHNEPERGVNRSYRQHSIDDYGDIARSRGTMHQTKGKTARMTQQRKVGEHRGAAQAEMA